MTSKKNGTNLSFSDLSLSEKDSVLNAVKRGASRRDVLKMMSALGVGAAAGGSIFMGASNAWAQTPKKGGKLIIAADQTGPADTLDPSFIPPRSITPVAACFTAR